MRGQTNIRFFALALLACLAWSATSTAETVPTGMPNRNNRIVFGYSSQVFYNVDPKDFIGLAEVWSREAERKLINNTKTTIVIYKTPPDTEKALAKNEVDILVMIPEEFVRLREQYHLVPVLSADFGMHFYNELLLLVRKDSGIKQIKQLRGKSIRIDMGQQGSIPMKWLDSFLTARVSSMAKGFFGNISEYNKSNQVLMPVFFGQADACLVSRSHFETMVELNPQIGSQLRILEQSPGFVTGIIAVREGFRNSMRDSTVKLLEEMYTEPKGKQIMTLFRINRLVPFMPEHLTSVEKVLREHRGKTDSLSRRKY